MKTVIQRVSYARVTIENKVHGEIQKGYMVLVGFCDEDDEATVRKVADKLCKLRIFDDEDGKMNLDIQQVEGAILSISQFTLFADCKKGNRPSFAQSGSKEHASALYDYFNAYIRDKGIRVETGIFAADMKVELLNDGPVTICLDSSSL